MENIGATIKNMVFRNVLPRSTVINIPKEFAEFANTLSTILCLYFYKSQITSVNAIPYSIPLKRTKLSKGTVSIASHVIVFLLE